MVPNRRDSGLKPENALNTAAKAHGVSVFQVALAWLLERSSVMLPIPGTVVSRASGRKRRRGEAQIDARRMESD